MKEYRKITTGFVIQTYLKKKDRFVCAEQEFIASDQVEYENDDGEPVDVDTTKEDYQPFYMTQPGE